MSSPDPRLAKIALQHQLGSFVALHPGLQGYMKAALGAIALGAAVLSSVWWLRYGSADQQSAVYAIGLPTAGALFVVVGLVGFVRLKGRAVELHADGLVYKEGSRVTPIAYRDMIALHMDLTEVHNSVGTSYRGKLVAHLNNGSQVRLRPNIEKLGAVLDALTRGAARYVVGNVVAQLQAGRTVSSGPLQFTPAGIVHRGRVVPYASLWSVHERSASAMLSDSTKVKLELMVSEGDTISVPAGAVLHRQYIEAIASAMKPVVDRGPQPTLSFDDLTAHQQFDESAGQALRSRMPAHWEDARLEIRFDGQGQPDALVMLEPSTGDQIAADAVLTALAQQIAYFHISRQTGANVVTYDIDRDEDGDWELETSFSASR